MHFFWSFLAVFVSLTVVDAAWALYLISMQKYQAARAGFWGAFIVAVGAYATISYVHDPRLLIAAVLGGFVGTYATVKYHHIKEKRAQDALCQPPTKEVL